VVAVFVVMSPTGIAYTVRGGGNNIRKKLGIPPVSESGRIHCSLVVFESHFIDWGHHSSGAVICRSWCIVERCQPIGQWWILSNDDVDSCRHTVKLQLVLQLCSGLVVKSSSKFRSTVDPVPWTVSILTRGVADLAISNPHWLILEFKSG